MPSQTGRRRAPGRDLLTWLPCGAICSAGCRAVRLLT